MIRASLDEPMVIPPSEPSPTEPATRASEPTPMPTQPEVPRDLAELVLPERTTRGGFYGAAVLERVLTSYYGRR